MSGCSHTLVCSRRFYCGSVSSSIDRWLMVVEGGWLDVLIPWCVPESSIGVQSVFLLTKDRHRDIRSERGRVMIKVAQV